MACEYLQDLNCLHIFQALSRIELLAKHQGHTNDGFKYYTKLTISSSNVTCDTTEEMDQLYKLASDH